jgi:hypothetical protein
MAFYRLASLNNIIRNTFAKLNAEACYLLAPSVKAYAKLRITIPQRILMLYQAVLEF